VSAILKDRAIILRTREFGETSLVVTALLRAAGRTGLLAKGARRPGSQLHGRFRTGNLGDLVYYGKEGRALQTVREFSAAPVIDPARAGLETLCIFQAGLELVDRISTAGETGEGLFDLFEGFIRSLDRCRDPWAVFFALEAGLLGSAGVMPDLQRCDRCKKLLAGCVFSVNPSTGAVTCAGCGASGPALGAAGCRLLELVTGTDRGAVLAAETGPAVRRELGTVLHRLLEHHVAGYRLPAALSILKGKG
jgi:DNA repair protein RecO (recombination protein O)